MADDIIGADTMGFVKTIDKQLGPKYVVSLQEVLADPTAIARKQNPQEILSNLKSDVTSYFEALLKSLEDEEKRFTADLQNATELYSKVNEFIKAKAQIMNVPMIKPVGLERDASKEETIVISMDDIAIELLITRLISSATYIADTSTSYKSYTIGSWMFSGPKNYNITVNPPSSIILNIESSRDEITFRLDAIVARL